MATMSFSSEKMTHVILFFLERINNVHLGRSKLMKLLYYVDFDHYERRGRPITGAAYRKLPHGPVPTRAEALIEQMERQGLVQEVSGKVRDYHQRRLIAQSGFDASRFSGDELETLEAVAEKWRDHSAAEIEASSHAEAPWSATMNGKLIDYELANYRRPIGEEAMDEKLAKSSALKRYVAALA